MIEVRNLHKYYGPLHVLRGIDVDIAKGEVFSVIGPSGSGKSTFLRCLNFLEEYQEGDVRFDGRLVGYRETAGKRLRAGAGSIAAMRTRMGMVFQSFNLFPHLTALDNIALPPRVNLRLARRDAEDRAAGLLASVGLAEFGRKYPGELSGGQQQRVAIARALAMQPDVLLFDEPTSALDPESIGEVLDVMVALAASGRTMIVATHEMGFARRVCQHVVFMDRGHVVECTPPEEFFVCPRSDRARTFVARIGQAGKPQSA